MVADSHLWWLRGNRGGVSCSNRWESCPACYTPTAMTTDLLLHAQNVDVAAVLSELRRRFGVSGIDEKASRK